MSLKINKDGSLIWTNRRGLWHRAKGPAVIYPTGRIEYWLNHDFHRLDGPAIIRANGIKSYFIHGIRYSKENYLYKIKGYEF